MRADLFGDAAMPSRKALREARARGEEGAARAADAAERRVPGWCELAVGAVRRFAAGHPPEFPFTMEMLRSVVEREIPSPHDRRAWGRVTTMAIKREFIVPMHGRMFPAASSNGACKPVYRRGPKA